MRRIDMKILFSCMFGILSAFMADSLSYAQNFTGAAGQMEVEQQAQESEYNDDFLMEDELQQILSHQGSSVPAVNSVGTVGDFSESTYTLGPEDVIKIDVSRHPEVSGEYIINAEGKIQYGFVGDIEVAGMTKTEVTAHLQEVLGKYIISPELTVTITGYNSKIVYVVGEVGRPGKIFMRGDTITVREALVQAALPLLTAKAQKSLLITPSDDGKPMQKRVNVHKLLYEGDLRENLVMKPGDTLYIPPTFLTKTMRAIQPVAQPVGTAAGTGRTVMTGF